MNKTIDKTKVWYTILNCTSLYGWILFSAPAPKYLLPVCVSLHHNQAFVQTSSYDETNKEQIRIVNSLFTTVLHVSTTTLFFYFIFSLQLFLWCPFGLNESGDLRNWLWHSSPVDKINAVSYHWQHTHTHTYMYLHTW